MTVTECRKNGLFTYTFDYGDSKTIKTVDSKYRSVSWKLIELSSGTEIYVVLKDDGYHIDGKYKGKKLHKVVGKAGKNAWMQGIGYCGGHFLKKGDTYEYESMNLRNGKAYDMIAVYVGEEVMEGKKVHHFCMSPKSGLAKFWKSHYYYDVTTGDLVAQRSMEGLPGSPKTVWKVL